MIYLFTGTPGAGKTLNAINFVLTDSVFNVKVNDPNDPDKLIDKIENGLVVKRDVYYFNIKEVKHPWIELSEEQVNEWYDLPSGSVIFIDECQDVFTGVQRNNALPPLYSRLNKHRHQGHDLILVTQGGSLLTSCVRPLVNRHYHLENEAGGEFCKWVTLGKFIDNPDKKATRSQCEVQTKRYPKHLYGTYKSADVHTKKFRVPKIYKRVLVLTVLLFVVFGLMYFYFITSINGAKEKAKELEPVVQVDEPLDRAVGRRSSTSFESELPMDPVEYMEVFKPRIQGIPITAPIYDSFVSSPVAPPKTLCVGRYAKNDKYVCTCFTEQMTRLDVPHNTCVNIIENGLYDVTLSPEQS